MVLREFKAKQKQKPKTGAGEMAQHVREDPSAGPPFTLGSCGLTPLTSIGICTHVHLPAHVCT